MAQWHLDELHAALARRGWVVGACVGDGHAISATWALQRAGDPRRIYIDFEGLDERGSLPVERCYACAVRGTDLSLYFRRRGADVRAQARWSDELRAFVADLDQVAVADEAGS
ncbi:hypothetical protein [Ottowia sp.]|uniref:hypothetical protein n=1 Tax=Ottowia sp. TaxID=1898956 RepID=UPI003A8B3268